LAKVQAFYRPPKISLDKQTSFKNFFPVNKFWGSFFGLK